MLCKWVFNNYIYSSNIVYIVNIAKVVRKTGQNNIHKNIQTSKNRLARKAGQF